MQWGEGGVTRFKEGGTRLIKLNTRFTDSIRTDDERFHTPGIP